MGEELDSAVLVAEDEMNVRSCCRSELVSLTLRTVLVLDVSNGVGTEIGLGA